MNIQKIADGAFFVPCYSKQTIAWYPMGGAFQGLACDEIYENTESIPMQFFQENIFFKDDLASQFRTCVETWHRQTQHLSSIIKMVSHPAYVAIIEMGHKVIPLLLEELRDRPDHWFVALNRITGEDPVVPGSTFNEAVGAWLVWGRGKGYLQ